MSSVTVDPGLHGYVLSSQVGRGSYEPSVTSSAASSQLSVFSDAGSAQSSIASSYSDDFRLSQEDTSQVCTQAFLQQQAKAGHVLAAEHQRLQCVLKTQCGQGAPSYADVTSVPSEQRQHPRRSSVPRSQKPPPLVRQCERKVAFVDNLVEAKDHVGDSATQMVEVIWPLSVVPRCESDRGRGVLPLRTYIEETLRRSRTSYSTLQVALYYLVLIKPYVPKFDFTMEQQEDCPASRALQCGRRMFLAALILASKYLQDRNYSAKAWSKMSGLKVDEINTNERTFLSKVSWKLHIPDLTFKRWADVVLRYTPGKQPPSPGQSCAISWKTIVPILTPELDNLPFPHNMQLTPAPECSANYSYASSTTPTPASCALAPIQIISTSHESTPTPTSVLPRFLEPRLDMAAPTPALARMGPLPTPQMTPSYIASSTPAVNALSSRRPSMSCAMAMAQKAGVSRCSMDTYPGTLPGFDSFQFTSRRPSISTVSSGSSPESMISDRSRASSISSISTVSTTSSLALGRACLARQATCRNVPRLHTLPAAVREEKEGTVRKPIVIADDTEMVCASPENVDFTISDKVLHTPHRHSKHALHPQPTSAVSTEKGRKRARPRGGRRTGLQEEVRIAQEEFDAMDVDVDYENDDVISPSPAAEYAAKLLSRSNSVTRMKEVQPPAALARRESNRVPVQKYEGKKRTCCSTSAMSISPSPLYGEVA
ncbi:hypothetical protein LTR36_009986 [Oleoguttula mirabilis]|uniref:G1/S-specific cyclin pas1 n=1 Tax=Oleoguttula mirabilis TaxID=1507867 RepID=A0AAV9JST2_9PEZI|nr:hypothetical protein LTR36_009986 [Oleoguttula mirabilis]